MNFIIGDNMDNFTRTQQILNGAGINPDNMGGENKRFYKLPTDRVINGVSAVVKMRILPKDLNNSDFPFRVILKHYDIPGAARGLNCLKTWGMHCPICSALDSLSNKIDISRMSATIRPMANALVLHDPTPQNANPVLPHIVTFTGQLFSLFMNIWSDEGKRSMFDAINGRNIELVRERDKGPIKYSIDFDKSPISASQQEVQNIMANVYDLDEMWKSPDDNDVRNMASLASGMVDSIHNKMAMNGEGMYNQPTLPQQQWSQPQPPQQQWSQPQPPQQQWSQPQPPQQQWNHQTAPVPQQWSQPSHQPVGASSFNRQPQQLSQPNNFNTPPTQSPQQQWSQSQPTHLPASEIPFGASQQNNNNNGVKIEYVVQDNPEAAQPLNVSTPPAMVGAPSCFGDKSKYAPNSQECVCCNFEFNCAKKVAAGG